MTLASLPIADNCVLLQLVEIFEVCWFQDLVFYRRFTWTQHIFKCMCLFGFKLNHTFPLFLYLIFNLSAYWFCRKGLIQVLFISPKWCYVHLSTDIWTLGLLICFQHLNCVLSFVDNKTSSNFNQKLLPLLIWINLLRSRSLLLPLKNKLKW